ncbi:MAG: hypoxanthine phosphoribosyltransferase [Clostridia bacterium]|nr:hypoxanthine phosphoribosyltransferase [Clostridia bacterium]
MTDHNTLRDEGVERILISEEELDRIVSGLAERISEDYKDKTLLMLCILKGSIVFMGDLMKKLTIPCEIDCMKVSSYGKGTVSGGRINILLDLHRSDLSEKDILIIEDIIDSGKTLSYLVEYLKINGARSVKSVALLDKPSRREVDYKPDYTGLEIPDEFVIGYGLDYAEKYRSLPYVGILKREVYMK